MIVGTAFAVIAEGFALARNNGVDAQSLYDAIREGWAGSKVLGVSGPAIAAHELYVAGQAAGFGKKSQPSIFELWGRQEGA